MEYHNLQTENNYNYPVFNPEIHMNNKKVNNYYNIPLQLQDKNDLKESLLPKDTYYEEFKQSSFNYVQPKQTGNYSINDIECFDSKNNNYVESRENQINLIRNHISQEQSKKPLVSTNFVVKNEACSFGNSSNIPTQQSIQMNEISNQNQKIPIVNYSFNNNLSNSVSNYNNNNPYKPVGSSLNNINYPDPTPINYAFQPQKINNNDNNQNNNNVISYSFTKQNQNVSNISEENSINSVKPQAKVDQSSKSVQNNQSVCPNYQQIE
jgi:hypothetical protein